MELKLRLTWFDKQAESFIDICKCECFIEFYYRDKWCIFIF
ncbi:Uncharacterised protein [Yersinia similis]|uniref:Cloacin n=1 Tax=Yersinia similis TaxID=367190 RepID=A0A0T9Q092_9GAMM|nr:Uncharacterised protein [Yersinia similis]CNB41068.1 Uncharacterised protein [Yersinia similis]CNE71052.1 Uncharacterised protein [Yersinia similis]CNF76084.1 Uncharacterised protein [Yersinia similis]CNH90274.1 Uncharacterised protein [Yersinia similis]